MAETDPQRLDRRYLEECAGLCPHCEAPDQLFRYTARAKPIVQPDTAPRVQVPCGCGRCGGVWYEVYTLTGVAVPR